MNTNTNTANTKRTLDSVINSLVSHEIIACAAREITAGTLTTAADMLRYITRAHNAFYVVQFAANGVHNGACKVDKVITVRNQYKGEAAKRAAYREQLIARLTAERDSTAEALENARAASAKAKSADKMREAIKAEMQIEQRLAECEVALAPEAIEKALAEAMPQNNDSFTAECAEVLYRTYIGEAAYLAEVTPTADSTNTDSTTAE